MNGAALFLATLATAWITVVTVAFFLLGIWLNAHYPGDGIVAYWMTAWIAFGALGAAPLIIYESASQ